VVMGRVREGPRSRRGRNSSPRLSSCRLMGGPTGCSSYLLLLLDRWIGWCPVAVGVAVRDSSTVYFLLSLCCVRWRNGSKWI
jgi:hypothetical protein